MAERYEKGQPVLIGTTSVERSEYLSRQFTKRKIPHNVLNAKYHEQEANIIAEAGRLGAITVATNMAGRGTDIVLGGNADFLADKRLREKGLDPVETPEEYEAAWDDTLTDHQGGGRQGSREGRRGRRAVRAGHRTPRVPAYRQPAARPLRPPGRPAASPGSTCRWVTS